MNIALSSRSFSPRRALPLVTAAAAVVLAGAALAWPHPAPAPQTGSGAATATEAPILAGPRTLVVQVPTAMRDEPVPATLVLPSAYETEPERAFSVLYMLHGAGGDHTAWTAATDIEALAEAHETIVVCPDAGKTSWYFDSPLDPTYQYETFFSKELVAWIDAHYRTRPAADRRAIGGLSMGGHGALFLAIRHSDVFGTAVAFSGGVDIRPFPGGWDIAQRIGSFEDAPERWEELTVINQARSLKRGQLAISIDCGVDDFFLDVNRALHAQLVEAKIPHDYTERPGGHSWAYWNRSVRYQMVFVSEHINR